MRQANRAGKDGRAGPTEPLSDRSCMTRPLLQHQLQAEIALYELLVDPRQEGARRLHTGQAVVGYLQVGMEVRKVLKLRREHDLLQLFLLAHAEAVSKVTRAELTALELLDHLALAKCLRQKLGRRRIVQAKNKMYVEIVEKGLLLVGAVDTRH